MSEQESTPDQPSWPSVPVSPQGNIEPVAAVSTPAVTAQRTSSDAVVAFVLSIVSWAVCPVIFAVVALIFAAKATKSLDASGSQLNGAGLNLAAKIISWVNIGFWVAILVIGAFIGLVLVLAGAGSQPAHP
jgi:hypothetical protein